MSMQTPLMRQYHDIKSRYNDALVLFQVGDFYEFFFDDAKKASSFLGIALTSRGMQDNEPIPLCGVPVHTVQHYITKLVKGGYRVVLCDQLTPAQPGKIVQRGVTNVFTPGTLTDANLLEEKSASYLAALSHIDDQYSLAFIELLTGQLFFTILPKDDRLLEAELARFSPDEILLQDDKSGAILQHIMQRYGYSITIVAAKYDDTLIQAVAALLESSYASMHSALCMIYYYLQHHHPRVISCIKQCQYYKPEEFLLIDAATQRNLELVVNNYDGTRQNSLLSVLDTAVTAMGSRTMQKWLLRPLVTPSIIERRLNVVDMLHKEHGLRIRLRQCMTTFGDLERIVGRVALRRAHLFDYQQLLKSLGAAIEFIEILGHVPVFASFIFFKDHAQEFSVLRNYMMTALNDDTTKEWRIKAGFNAELDRLRILVEDVARAIAHLERKEQEATGISSLKIRYNRTQGYGIEVTKPNLHLVPPHYIRSHSLMNRERFVTQELKDLEYDINRSHGAIEELEQHLFEELCHHIENYLPTLRLLAQSVAQCDVLTSFAHNAAEHGYTRPLLHEGRDIVIIDGRHPVVERYADNHFIANNTSLTDAESLWIITGPNMGGKSTYLRQVALINIMAQAGSFVPARMAQLPILDRIFTRLGATDKVASGKSTFLVEMEETSLICTYATPKSLVILDEVGRGTSTYDGLAIAQAVVEYVYNTVKARCLFATHYHELTALSLHYAGISSYYVASKKTADGIVLLHKVVKGITDGSFGIEVARRAGLPLDIINRAEMILSDLKQVRSQHIVSS